MKSNEIFFNPFRIISPKLDSEASRLHQIYDSPPEEITTAEEGLLVIMNNLMQMVPMIRKSVSIFDPEVIEKAESLAKDVHDEEKTLTDGIVSKPTEVIKDDVLKSVVLFPGRLERVGDYLESVCNVCRIKARERVLFSDKANKELDGLFDAFEEVLKAFHDALITGDKSLLEEVIEKDKKLSQLSLDSALGHEHRLCEGICFPKASSMFLDILDSLKGAGNQFRNMAERLLEATAKKQ